MLTSHDLDLSQAFLDPTAVFQDDPWEVVRHRAIPHVIKLELLRRWPVEELRSARARERRRLELERAVAALERALGARPLVPARLGA